MDFSFSIFGNRDILQVMEVKWGREIKREIIAILLTYKILQYDHRSVNLFLLSIQSYFVIENRISMYY